MKLHKIYEGDDSIEFFNLLSALKNKKLKIKNELIIKNKNMDKEFEQNYYPRTARMSSWNWTRLYRNQEMDGIL